MATRTFAGWGGRPKGEPAKVCQNRRFCQNLHKKLIFCKERIGFADLICYICKNPKIIQL